MKVLVRDAETRLLLTQAISAAVIAGIIALGSLLAGGVVPLAGRLMLLPFLYLNALFAGGPGEPSVVDIFSVGGYPGPMTVNTETNRLFLIVAHDYAGDDAHIAIIDLRRHAKLATLPLPDGKGPLSARVGPWRLLNAPVRAWHNEWTTSRWIAQVGPYTTDSSSNKWKNDSFMFPYYVLNEETRQIEAAVSGLEYATMGFSAGNPSTGRVFSTRVDNLSIEVCTQRQCRQIPTLPDSKHIAINDRTNRVYVANKATGTIWVIQDRPSAHN